MILYLHFFQGSIVPPMNIGTVLAPKRIFEGA